MNKDDINAKNTVFSMFFKYQVNSAFHLEIIRLYIYIIHRI